MRRLADELEAGPASLYYYVPSKRDLLALMEDAVMAELIVPEEALATTWREGLTEIAQRLRTSWQRRPWAITSLHTARIGPNGLRLFEQFLQVLSELDLTAAETLEIIALVNDYVLGFVIHANAADTAGDEWVEDVAAFMATQLSSGDFPRLSALLGDEDADTFVRKLDAEAVALERFDRGLTRLLDGVAANLDKSGQP